MNRTAALFAALALLVAGVAVPASGTVPLTTGQNGQVAPSNESAAPGARLAGVVAVGAVEVQGEVADRAFGIQVARAASNGSKASVVADRVADLERRLATIRERQRVLEQARENGTITRARYAAEVAALSARGAAVDRQLSRAAAVSATLPEDVLAERGVNASAIETLRSDARNLTGPEVAEIASTVAGPGAGRGLAADGNATQTPPADRPTPPVAGSTDRGSVEVDNRTDTGRSDR